MTGNPYDVMIEGKGFLPVTMPNTGEVVFTRAGNFKLESQGRMSLHTGALLQPVITIPSEATSVIISGTGEVKALTGTAEQSIGQIQLANFINPQGLQALGNGLYKQTAASGQVQSLVPGEGGTGLLQQGALETSRGLMVSACRKSGSFSQASRRPFGGSGSLRAASNLPTSRRASVDDSPMPSATR